MNPIIIRSLVCGSAVLLLLALPAAASQVLTGESLTPASPLVAGGQQHAFMKYMVIPSGATTFPKGHNLQMQTNLTGAQWAIQVIVDGNNAAYQTGSGTTEFVNGVILSYPTTKDVSFTVTIDGTVPASATGTVTVLRMVEIDNTGNAMPGSQSVISPPLAGTAAIPVPVISAAPVLTPLSGIPAAAATRSPGFEALPGIAAAALGGLAWMRHRC
jgi:hypothetical protein